MAQRDLAGAVRWAVAVLAGLALIGLLAYRRNEPGVGDRFPDPDAVVVVVTEPSTTG